MMNPECDHTVFAIAGRTSTGKTRLGEQMVLTLRKEYNVTACFFSVGDIHRLLTNVSGILHEPHETAEQLALQTLERTEIAVDENGRIRFIYNGKSLRQTYQNGNHAAHVSCTGNVSGIVDRFIESRVFPSVSAFQYLGFDGRERRGASILFRTTAPDETRVQIRRIEQPECESLPAGTILSDIHARDEKDQRFMKPLQEETDNVVHILRQDPSHEGNRELAEKTTGILMQFANGHLGPSFGTIEIS